MTGDEYLLSILQKYPVNIAGAKAAGQMIYPVLEKWGNGYLNKAEFSGLSQKGQESLLGPTRIFFFQCRHQRQEPLLICT